MQLESKRPEGRVENLRPKGMSFSVVSSCGIALSGSCVMMFRFSKVAAVDDEELRNERAPLQPARVC